MTSQERPRHTHVTRDIKAPGQCPVCDTWHAARFSDVVPQQSLPPTQYLMMETLAARHRLGHDHWTFPKTHAPIAKALADKNLVAWKSGVSQGTIEVWLTQAGKDCCLSPTYTYPVNARGH